MGSEVERESLREYSQLGLSTGRVGSGLGLT